MPGFKGAWVQGKVEGEFPLTSDPLILSLGGARKIKETGYHRSQAAYLKEKQYEHY
jgi:hypothetical protein